jgi:hypothetical protein
MKTFWLVNRDPVTQVTVRRGPFEGRTGAIRACSSAVGWPWKRAQEFGWRIVEVKPTKHYILPHITNQANDYEKEDA